MGRRTTYTSLNGVGAIINPRVRGRRSVSRTPIVITDPFGNQASVIPGPMITQQTAAIKDARGVRTTFTYQLQNNGAYLVSGIQKPGFNSGTGIGQYSFIYNNNNQVKAVVGRDGQPLDLRVG